MLTLTGHNGWVQAVAIAPDGKKALSASGDSTLKLWNLETGKEISTLTGHNDWVIAVAIAETLDEDEYEIKVILDKWREFLNLESIAAEIYYSLYHASFRDWLRQPNYPP